MSLPLYSKSYPCSATPLTDCPLVLLHGWGFDSAIWQSLLPLLRESFFVITVDLPGFGQSEVSDLDLSSVLDKLKMILPEKNILLGWSLGGMLATAFSIKYPQRVEALISVGSNLKWLAASGVSNDDVWQGMPEESFQQFFQGLKDQPDMTLKRFSSLITKGDVNEKKLLPLIRRTLKESANNGTGSALLQALLLLTEIDNRQGIQNLALPGLHIFGENDALVPFIVASRLVALSSTQQVHIMTDTAHAPFLSEPKEFTNLLCHFVRQLEGVSSIEADYRLNKQHVARSFSRAAKSYDAAAALQRDIGCDLLTLLKTHQAKDIHKSSVILDLGCGTGSCTQLMQENFSKSPIIGLDIAQGMLSLAKEKLKTNFNALCADAENLPLKENSIACLYSNLSIQWCQNNQQLFQEIYRCLTPGGMAFISTFQEGTLFELKEAWAAVDSQPHVNHFFSMNEISENVFNAGFSHIEIQEKTHVQYYADVKELLLELKSIGAHNLNQGKQSGLMSPKDFKLFVKSYNQLRDSGGRIPATYRTLYLCLTK